MMGQLSMNENDLIALPHTPKFGNSGVDPAICVTSFYQKKFFYETLNRGGGVRGHSPPEKF